MVTEMSNCAGHVLRSVDALVVEFRAADRVFGLLVCMLGEHWEPYLPRVRRSVSVAVVKLTRGGENCTVGGAPHRPSPTPPRSPAEGWVPFPLDFGEFTDQLSLLCLAQLCLGFLTGLLPLSGLGAPPGRGWAC